MRSHAGHSRRLRVAICASTAGVFLLAFLMRLHPVRSESLHWDSVSYVKAAREGVLANWLDQGHPGIDNFGKIWDLKIDYGQSVIRQGVDTLWLRHHHPPVLAYILTIQEVILGHSDFRVRVYSILCGALNCALLVIAVTLLRRWSPLAIVSGVAAGTLLAATPDHLFASRTASYHALFPLVASAFLLALSAALHTKRHGWLAASLLLLALGVATFEPAILLTVSLLVGLLAFPNPWVTSSGGYVKVSRRLVWYGMGGALLFVAVWPAGVIKADLLQNLLYNSLFGRGYTAGKHWWDCYRMYYDRAPAVAILQSAALIYFLGKAVRRRLSAGETVWLSFFVAFGLASLAQKLVYSHYLTPLFPAAALLSALLAHDAAMRLGRRGGFLMPLAVVLVAGHATARRWKDPVTDPLEIPGFSQAAQFFRECAEPEDSILSTAAPLLRFYLSGYDIREIPFGPTPPSTIGQIRQHRYRHVLIYKDQLDRLDGYRDDRGYMYVAQKLALVKTIRHLRRGFECVWIYEDPHYRRPARVPIAPSLFRLLEARPGTDLWHVPFAELPFEQEDLVQLYVDNAIMRNGGGYPYRDWDERCYWPHTYKPEIGLVVGVPHGHGPTWFQRHRYEAAVWQPAQDEAASPPTAESAPLPRID